MSNWIFNNTSLQDVNEGDSDEPTTIVSDPTDVVNILLAAQELGLLSDISNPNKPLGYNFQAEYDVRTATIDPVTGEETFLPTTKSAEQYLRETKGYEYVYFPGDVRESFLDLNPVARVQVKNLLGRAGLLDLSDEEVVGSTADRKTLNAIKRVMEQANNSGGQNSWLKTLDIMVANTRQKSIAIAGDKTLQPDQIMDIVQDALVKGTNRKGQALSRTEVDMIVAGVEDMYANFNKIIEQTPEGTPDQILYTGQLDEAFTPQFEFVPGEEQELPEEPDVDTVLDQVLAGREEFLAADKEDPMERLNSNLYGYERAVAERPPRR